MSGIIQDLELVSVTKRYGTALAVNAVSHRFRPASYTCLLGPSGCGKSSTLRMIAGHESVTEGSILLAHRDISNLPPAKRGTAMMFQSYALFPHLSVLDNVAFSLKMKGVDAKEFYATAVRADVDEVKLAVKSGRFYDNGHAVYAEVQYDLCLWEQGIRGGSVVTVNIGSMLQQEINDRDDHDHREAMGGDYDDGEFVRDDEESESEQEGEVSPSGGRASFVGRSAGRATLALSRASGVGLGEDRARRARLLPRGVGRHPPCAAGAGGRHGYPHDRDAQAHGALLMGEWQRL